MQEVRGSAVGAQFDGAVPAPGGDGRIDQRSQRRRKEFNLAAGSRTAIGCACTPATLVPMGNVFRLTELTGAPLWLLDSGASTPRTVFVPARGE